MTTAVNLYPPRNLVSLNVKGTYKGSAFENNYTNTTSTTINTDTGSNLTLTAKTATASPPAQTITLTTPCVQIYINADGTLNIGSSSALACPNLTPQFNLYPFLGETGKLTVTFSDGGVITVNNVTLNGAIYNSDLVLGDIATVNSNGVVTVVPISTRCTQTFINEDNTLTINRNNDASCPTNLDEPPISGPKALNSPGISTLDWVLIAFFIIMMVLMVLFIFFIYFWL